MNDVIEPFERDDSVLDLIKEKAFLGREFLTWLWFKSEQRSGSVSIGDGIDILVSFERTLVLDTGEGPSKEIVSLKGRAVGRDEARMALSVGKKISMAGLRIWRDNLKWRFVLKADTFDISGLKAEASFDEAEDFSFVEDTGVPQLEAKALEGVFLMERTTDTLDRLFRSFLLLRIDSKAWREEKQEIKRWATL